MFMLMVTLMVVMMVKVSVAMMMIVMVLMGMMATMNVMAMLMVTVDGEGGERTRSGGHGSGAAMEELSACLDKIVARRSLGGARWRRGQCPRSFHRGALAIVDNSHTLQATGSTSIPADGSGCADHLHTCEATKPYRLRGQVCVDMIGLSASTC